MAVTRAPIRLRIERLVVEGVSLADPSGLGRAVESELARLLAGDGGRLVDAQTGSIDRLETTPVTWSDDGSGDSMGRRLALAVHGSLRGVRS
jgi:hypothetical protein